jgi:phosphohistidine phosphatase
MPRLILLRHATAERAGPGESDHDRALTKGGKKESKAAGRVIAKHDAKIDLVLSSDARRTRETWEAVATEIDAKPDVRYLRSMFEAPDYLPTLKKEGRKASSVLLIGHNPAMHGTAIEIAASLSGRDGGKLRLGFPKAALAMFEFDGEWKSLRPGQMQLTAFIEPDED